MQAVKFDKHDLDIDQLAHVLAESLHDDPFSRYIFPDHAKRHFQLPLMTRVFIQNALKRGEVYILLSPQREYCGGALWLSSANPILNPLHMVMGLLQPSTMKIFGHLRCRGIYRSMYYGDFIEKAHKQQPPRHYYLMTLGIAPVWQNRGLGIELLRPVMRKAAQERCPCYLETTNRANHSFYRKHGYEIVHECTPKGGPTFWGMHKSPHSHA